MEMENEYNRQGKKERIKEKMKEKGRTGNKKQEEEKKNVFFRNKGISKAAKEIKRIKKQAQPTNERKKQTNKTTNQTRKQKTDIKPEEKKMYNSDRIIRMTRKKERKKEKEVTLTYISLPRSCLLLSQRSA